MYQKKIKSQIIYGRNPILEALEGGTQFEKIVLKSGLKGPFEQEITEICKEKMIPVRRVPQIRLDTISRNKNHQGIVGYISVIEYQDIRNVVPFLYEQGITPNLLILDGITDVRNLGAIARSCEVLGANALILPQSNSAEINEDTIKTSTGAIFKIPVCREVNLLDTIDYLKECGINIIVSTLEAEKYIFDIDLTVPIATIIGSEQKGVNSQLLARSDDKFKIPQKGETDSLNVSVAAGIILYECLHQRQVKD